MVQNKDLDNKTRISLLKIGKLFNDINPAIESATAALGNFSAEINTVSADSTEYGQRLNKSIQETTSAISELESMASRLNDTVNEINPLSVAQARRIVSSGNLDDPNLQAALSTLSNMGTDNFSSSLDYLRAKGANAAAVVGLQGVIGNRIAAKNKELAQFEFEKAELQAGLSRAAQMYASFPRYASGSSYIERTGPAIVHQGERIINPAQNSDLVEMLRQVVAKVGTSASETSGLTSLIKSLIQDTTSGRSIRTSAI
jgi:hypothetical protein